MRFVSAIASIALAMSLAGCASAPPVRNDAPSPRSDEASKSRPTTADYRRYVRGNVQAFNASNVTDWDAPDPQHVVVWTSPAEAYLLTLFGACFGLETSQSILLGDGAVIVGPERCAISKVERLDARRMRADGVH